MNTSQGALYFGAGIDMNEWRRNINEMRQDILGLTQQTQRETQQMDSAFKNLSIGIGAYFSVQALQGFTQQLINVRGEFQKTEIAFGTMLKSEEKAKSLMGEMVDLAAKTPFGLTDVTDGAKRLLAFQVPAEQVVDTLRRMGDVAAGLGVPMGQLIHVYGQVKAQGKLMTNDLYQFMNAGIPMVAELAKVMGVAENEVKDLISAGKVGFPEVQSVINNLTNDGGLFFNLMEKQSDSLSGKWANLQDQIEQMYNQIGESSEGLLASGIDGLAYLTENYQKVVDVLLVLISTYGAYRVALIAVNQTQAGSLTMNAIQGFQNLIKLIRGATVAQAGLNTVTLANPYVLLATAIVGVGAALYVWHKNTSQQVETQDKLNDMLEDTKKKIEDTKSKSTEYMAILRSESASKADVYKAYQDLQQLYPKYLQNIDAEAFKKKTLTEQNKILAEAQKDLEQNELSGNIKTTEQEVQKLKNLLDGFKNSSGEGFTFLDIADTEKALKIAEEKLHELHQKELQIVEAEKMANMEYHERKSYLEKQKSELEKILQAKKEGKNVLADIKNLSAEAQKYFANWNVGQLEDQLKRVSADIVAIGNNINNSQPKKADKDLTKNEVEAEIKRLQDEKAELTEISKIKEKNKEIDKYRLLAKKWDDNPLNLKKPTKAQINAPIKGSLGYLEKELSDLNTKISNKTLISDARTRATLLAKREALEKRIAEVRKLYTKKSFDEEIAELERQWKVRYQIEEKYGKETAKKQFSNLKGESYFDEIKSRFDALDKKQLSGLKLSDDEISQWQKLKGILDSLTGEKDPFTNWKESLDEQLRGMSTFSEKISKIKEKIKNLTPEQKSQGYEAELRNRLNEEEKAYRDSYNQFLQEHQTYEEKRIAITQKYADLRGKAETEAERKKIDQAESMELGSLSMDRLVNSDEWKIAFGELEYFSQDTLNRILAHFRRFKEENKENLSPDDLDRLRDGIARLETATAKNPFKALINSIKEYKNALADQKRAKEEFDRALNSGSIEKVTQKQKELTEAERRTAEERKRLANVLGQTQSAFNDAIQGINDMAEAFGGMSDAARGAMEDITSIANSGLDMAKNIVSGNVVGAVASGIKMIGSLFKALSGDKKKERAIQREQQALNRLKTAYEELSHAANKAFNARQYSDQTNLIRNLEQQRASLNNMIDSERSKKKTDWGKISEWQGQIGAINRAISDLKEGVIKDVLQTDLAGAASKVGDALVDAFGRGENAAQSLEKVANDMIKNLVKNQLNLMLQKRMQGTLQNLFKATGLNDDGTGVFKGLSKADIANFKAEVKSAGAGMQSFLEGYKEIFEGVESNDDSLKGAIKGMSEETASVLAGQFNAIRINTGEILKNQKQNLEAMKNSVDSLVKIEQNTFNLFQMRKDLSELNNKVKGDGSLRASGI